MQGFPLATFSTSSASNGYPSDACRDSLPLYFDPGSEGLAPEVECGVHLETDHVRDMRSLARSFRSERWVGVCQDAAGCLPISFVQLCDIKGPLMLDREFFSCGPPGGLGDFVWSRSHRWMARRTVTSELNAHPIPLCGGTGTHVCARDPSSRRNVPTTEDAAVSTDDDHILFQAPSEASQLGAGKDSPGDDRRCHLCQEVALGKTIYFQQA